MFTPRSLIQTLGGLSRPLSRLAHRTSRLAQPLRSTRQTFGRGQLLASLGCLTRSLSQRSGFLRLPRTGHLRITRLIRAQLLQCLRNLTQVEGPRGTIVSLHPLCQGSLTASGLGQGRIECLLLRSTGILLQLSRVLAQATLRTCQRLEVTFEGLQCINLLLQVLHAAAIGQNGVEALHATHDGGLSLQRLDPTAGLQVLLGVTHQLHERLAAAFQGALVYMRKAFTQQLRRMGPTFRFEPRSQDFHRLAQARDLPQEQFLIACQLSGTRILHTRFHRRCGRCGCSPHT